MYTDDRTFSYPEQDAEWLADRAARAEQRRNARRWKLGADGIIATALRSSTKPRRAADA